MANPNALYLLADHIKLSLLERQRSQALDLLQDDSAPDNGGAEAGAARTGDAQDGHVARSLEQFRAGLDALQQRADSDESLRDALPGLEAQYETLLAQFRGGPPPGAPGARGTPSKGPKKAVRFRDKPLPSPPGEGGRRREPDLEAQRGTLFGRYTDDDDDDQPNHDDLADTDNVQLHQMHARIMADQDAQLDALGASIGRQRELSMQIGDELDSHVAMLEESEHVVDRHQTRIDRARRQVGQVARAAGDCKQMVAIVVLIVILVLLIAILK